MKDRHFFAIVLISIGISMILLALAHAQPYPPPRPPLIQEAPPPFVIAPQPRCRVVRETKHDDILGTNDYVEHEECDED